MPNWVKCKVKFADKRVIKDCYSQNDTTEIFDFNKIIPMPKRLNLVSGGNEDVSVCYTLSKMSESKREEVIEKLKNAKCFMYGNYYKKFTMYEERYTEEYIKKAEEELQNKINGINKGFDEVNYNDLGIKNLEDLGNAYINNVIEYGSDTWYDWCNENWGTKWGACHVYYLDENNIEFDCAWSMPRPIFEKISEIYDTEVEVDFADEDIGSNCGRALFKNGVCYDFCEEDRFFAYKVWDYTEEEIEECESYYE